MAGKVTKAEHRWQLHCASLNIEQLRVTSSEAMEAHIAAFDERTTVLGMESTQLAGHDPTQPTIAGFLHATLIFSLLIMITNC